MMSSICSELFLLGRQHRIQLIESDVAALLALGDQAFYRGRLGIEHIGISFGFGGLRFGGGGGFGKP